MFKSPVFILQHLASLLVIGASAWVYGESVLRCFGFPPKDAGRPALATALGLGILAQGLFLLGMVGLLERAWILLALGVGHLLCLKTWREVLSAWTARLPMAGSVASRATFAAVMVTPLLALALYPPTGFDATVYHLPYVEAFLEAKRLTFVPELRFPVFPQVVEMGFLLGFVLSGEAAAKLTQVLSMFLTAALIFAWGRCAVSPRAGLLAAALWLGNPLTVWIAGLAYVDIGLTLFVVAAFVAWERFAEEDDPRWLALAGAFAGFAAGTKYLGLFFCAALFVMSAARAFRRKTFRPLLVLSAAATIAAAPWYLRILYYTGNPVFPFYSELFGASEWTHPPTESGFVDGLVDLLLLPWNAVFDREVFHFQAPLSPFYLLLLPLAAPFALRFSSRSRRWLLLVACYALFYLVTTRELRFFLPILPLLNLALGAGLEHLSEGGRSRFCALWKSRASALLAIAFFLPGWLYAVYKLDERGWPPVTWEERQEFLTAQIPAYGAVRWLNEEKGENYTLYALYGERLRYYVRGRFLGDWLGRASFPRLLAAMDDSRALYDELEELEAGYFLVRGRGPRQNLPRDAFFRRHFEPVLEETDFVLYQVR